MNKCFSASVIILLSNKTLIGFKRPVYAGSQFFYLFKLAKFYLFCSVSLVSQFQNHSFSNCFACIRYAFIRLYCHCIVIVLSLYCQYIFTFIFQPTSFYTSYRHLENFPTCFYQINWNGITNLQC